MMRAVRRFDSWSTTEAEITVPGIAERPVASFRGERAELFGSCQARASEGGYLDARARRGGLLRHRHGARGSGRLFFGALVGPDGARDGSLLDLGNRDRSGGQQAKNNADPTWDAAVAVLPTSDAPRADTEPPGDAALREAKRAERRAEFGH